MKNVINWIKKNIKEDADIQEVEKLVEGVTANSLIMSREDASKLVDENKMMLAELDSRISKSVENALVKFKDEKLPGMVEDEKKKIIAEMNPAETPEQKRLKDLETQLEEFKTKDLQEDLKTELRIKAKELNFDTLQAEQFFVHGENALSILAGFAEFQTNAIKEGIEKDMKNRFGNKTPMGGNKETLTPRSEVEAAYKKAMEDRDVSTAMQLKDQLAKMPVDEIN